MMSSSSGTGTGCIKAANVMKGGKRIKLK